MKETCLYCTLTQNQSRINRIAAYVASCSEVIDIIQAYQKPIKKAPLKKKGFSYQS